MFTICTIMYKNQFNSDSKERGKLMKMIMYNISECFKVYAMYNVQCKNNKSF